MSVTARVPAARSALITGITGQDGSYLAEFLLERGYRVAGLVRRSSSSRLERIEHLEGRLELVAGDLLDQSSLVRALERVQPDEIYNLAAQSFVPTSWQEPVLTAEATAVGVTRLLEAVRQVAPLARVFQASSSEMFGKVRETPQNERTPFHPRSPYGVSKVYAHHAAVNYRESYGLYVACGILFNHESPRRGLDFVTRKITHGAARVALGLASELRLGNLEAQRDWGYAGDTVRAMWQMLQLDEADDFVIATGETHTVRNCCEIAFGRLGVDWQSAVAIDGELLRPAEVDCLRGDATRAREILGWEPQMSFRELIETMVESDYRTLAGKPLGTLGGRAEAAAAARGSLPER